MSTYFATLRRRAHQKLWNKLDEHLLPHALGGAILAISGGPDSRALLEAVASWPNRLKGRWIVACVNHGIRKEAAHEARHIAMRAKRLGFASIVSEITPHSMSEHDLRRYRYDALAAIASAHKVDTIVTAHQRDDNAEGYLMALMGVGGGELGASMTEIERFATFVLCRPFLSLSKDDLLLSLSLAGQTDFVRDSCDETRRGKRAFVRHEILPMLTQHAANFAPRLQQFGRAQRAQAEIIDRQADHLISWHKDGASITLQTEPDHALIHAALWRIIKHFGDGRDLRAVGQRISSMIKTMARKDFTAGELGAGLDPSLNAFNLKAVNVKHYQVPGAVIFRTNHEIHVRRL